MTEWNAASYHKVSGPQTNWGHKVLARFEGRGDERAIDVGCGSGRLTGELMERLPRGSLVAIDRSWNMLIAARANLRPVFGSRVKFAQVTLPAMPFSGWADLVFSTATFHWVRDHQALFNNLFTTLRPGGRLIAQCGGGPNLARARAFAERLRLTQPFAPYFEQWHDVWEYASAEATAERLGRAGFADIETNLEEALTVLATEDDYREFVTTVIFHPYLGMLPDASLKQAFIDRVTEDSAKHDPPFSLDYWRLNLNAVKR
ncbi:MAG: methyltransferase domain-containing protein [Vicinamibacterales bacterium]